MTSKYRCGKIVGYIMRNAGEGCFISTPKLKAFCRTQNLKELVWGKKHYVILVENRNEAEAEEEKKKIAVVGYLALSKDHKYFYLKSRQHETETMGWTSLLAKLLKGETKRIPLHQRIPRETGESP